MLAVDFGSRPAAAYALCDVFGQFAHAQENDVPVAKQASVVMVIGPADLPQDFPVQSTSIAAPPMKGDACRRTSRLESFRYRTSVPRSVSTRSGPADMAGSTYERLYRADRSGEPLSPQGGANNVEPGDARATSSARRPVPRRRIEFWSI